MAREADAVIVGAGPNGLVAAAILAEAGCRVVVLEAADTVGGALRSEELTLPGFRHDVGATVVPLAAASPAFRHLDLTREGLHLAHPPTPLGHALTPARSALLHRSVAETAAGLGRDGGAWRRVLGALGERWEGLTASVLDPTALPPTAPRELFEFGLHGLAPAALSQHLAFRDEPARALFAGLAAHAVLELRQPLTAGIAVFLGALAHGVGWPVAVGGSQTIADALHARIRSHGGEVRTGHRIRSLDELPSARAVLLDLTPRQVLQVAGDRLPAGYARHLGRWRYGPGVFKLDWAIDGEIPWSDPTLAAAGTVHLGTPDEVVASERAVWRGQVTDAPFVVLVQACVADASRAPAGKSTGWAYVHVPHGDDTDRTTLIEERIEQFAPGFRERILARHAMSPSALEAWNPNLVGGDIGGGVTDWRQLAARPRLSLTPWATPVPGLFLCSSSTLPGGGAHGMGGWHAAHAALRELN